MTTLLRRCASEPRLVRFVADVGLLAFAAAALVVVLALG